MLAVDDRATLTQERFTAGLSVGERWQYLQAGPYAADDGVVVTNAAGISVAPAGRNPETGEPMFTNDAPGVLNHVKWLVTSTDTVDVDGGTVRIAFRAGARCFGMSRHPYGDAVADVDADYRLGSGVLNVIEVGSGVVFDFWIGETVIVPIYERLQATDPSAGYEAFTQVGDTVPRRPGTMHDLAITVDAGAHTVSWEVDGATVATIARIGASVPGWTTVLDHGGEPADVVPHRLAYALGLMTLLDGPLPPGRRGLVDLGEVLVAPIEFDASGPSLFGQGVQLDVEQILVQRW